jgi:hypothetical protein
MEKIIKQIYNGMLRDKRDFFLTKFVIMQGRKKDKRWDLLRKIKVIDKSAINKILYGE